MMQTPLRAPRENGGVLAIPALRDAPDLAHANIGRLPSLAYNFQGRDYAVLRDHARRELLAAASHPQPGAPPNDPNRPLPPIVMGGHQPELYHAGVWIKNFAVGAIARRLSAVPVHLIVDNDLPKSNGIRVPTLQNSNLRTVLVEFDDNQPEVPFEDWHINSRKLFDSFAERVMARLGGLVPEPLLDRHWPIARQAVAQAPNVGHALSTARRAIETSWGLGAREVPLSAVCNGDPFRWFLAHILAQLPRFHAIHNAALLSYRHANRIRSRNHPVPALETRGDWLEAPAWIWHADRPRRRPLLAQVTPKTIALRPWDSETPIATLRLAPNGDACCAVESLRALEEAGWRIRTRALTTTMYARLFLCDLFVHGIGGARYDELTDEIIRQFYGFEPPGFLALSMTLWPGISDQAIAPDEPLHTAQLIRDLTFNPDRHLGPSPPERAIALRDAKRAAIDAPQSTRKQRVQRWREIRALNSELAPFVARDIETAREQLQTLQTALAWNNQAHARDFAYVLHNGPRLREQYERALAPIGPW